MSEAGSVPDRDAPRATPYELIFGAAVFDESRFAAVRAQADIHGAASATQLFMAPAAGELLREFSEPGGGQSMVAQVSALLFSAYRFWRHGRHVFRLSDAELRALIGGSLTVTRPQPPMPAGYVQFPRNVMWARVAEDAVPEPVDGFFWSAPSADEGGAERLDLLFALGVRPGRPGVSLFDVALESAAQLEQWATVAVRPDGVDFANILPGGELQGYHAILTGAEALKLAALCFGRIAETSRRWSVAEEGSQLVHVAVDG